jgi:Mn2+/Fe2+ NRAMP family transporter
MSQRTDKLWSWLDSVASPFYPPGIRRCLTLGWLTVFVLLLVVGNILLRLLTPIGPAIATQARILKPIVWSPFFQVPFVIVLVFAAWLVVASKPRPEHQYLRGLLYGMTLAAILGEFMIFLDPAWL